MTAETVEAPAAYSATITALRNLPYTARQEQAKGFIAPLVRAIGHVLFLAAAHADENYTLSIGEATVELQDAATHLAAENVSDSPLISTTAKQHVASLRTCLDAAARLWPNITDDERSTLATELANRAAGLASFCDGEFAGLRTPEADAGISL